MNRGEMIKQINEGPMEEAYTDEVGDIEDEVIVIKTTESKLEEAEKMLLGIQSLNDVPSSLGNLAMAASAFQFTQAIVLYYLASKSEYNVSLYTNYASKEDASVPHPDLIGQFSLLWLAPAFITMSGIEHLNCVVFRKHYGYYLERHQNPFRWTEYSFSASTMRVMIALLVGVTDIQLLLCIFVLTATSIQCGAAHESVNAKARADNHEQNWYPYCTSWIGHFTSWIVIFTYVNGTVVAGHETKLMWVIVIVVYFLDSTFAILFTLQWKKIPPFDDYIKGEQGFVLLSFTAKTFLAWVMFVYTLSATPESQERTADLIANSVKLLV